MNQYEKDYYESEAFWQGEMLLDKPNQIRIEDTVKLVPGDVAQLVNIGCGNGVFERFLSQKRPEIGLLAMDRSEAALKYVEVANKRVGDITAIPLDDDSYDCASCLQVLEHLPRKEYEKALTELARISRKYVLISVPFREELERLKTTCPACKTTFNRDLHLRTFDRESIDRLLLPQGFTCAETAVPKMSRCIGFELIARFRRRFHKGFMSPICPVCGYVNEGFSGTGGTEGRATTWIKRYWPKMVCDGSWIIALYVKKAPSR